MPAHREVEALADALAASQEAIAELRAEVADLRRERRDIPQQGSELPAERVVSRRALFGLAGAGIAGVAVGAGAQPAAAADGDSLLLGTLNTASERTQLEVATPIGSAVRIDATGVGEYDYTGLEVNCDSDVGIWATSSKGYGKAVVADADGPDSTGVYARGRLMGVDANGGSYGVLAQSYSGVAAYLDTTTGAHLRLGRFNTPDSGPVVGPPDGVHEHGMISLDSNGDLFLCTAAGDPGTWVRLNGAHGPTMLPAPQRAFDSRASQPPSTGPKGKFTDGETRSIDLTASTDVPSSARAVLATVSVTATAGAGFASLYAGDQPTLAPPTFASLSWSSAGQTLSNAATVSLAAGVIKTYVSRGTHLIVDVVGYIDE